MNPVNDLRAFTRISLLIITLACVASMTIAAESTKGEAGSLQVSPSGDDRENILRALRGLRAIKSMRVRQVWSTADQQSSVVIEIVRPDRSHVIEKDEEAIYIGESSYQRKRNGPWKKFPEDNIATLRLPESDINEDIRRIGEVRFIGRDTTDDVSVLAYEYDQNDAPGKRLGSPRKIWIGVKDGLPRRTEDEIQCSSDSLGGDPTKTRLITVKVVATYYDYDAEITIELPERAAREAAESWLQLVDSGRYSDSWVEASGLLRERFSKEAWEKRLNQFAKEARELTPIKSRKLSTLESVRSLPSHHDREGVELSYRGTLEKPGTVLQRLELVFDTDEGWRVANYTEFAPSPIPTRATLLPEPRRLDPRLDPRLYPRPEPRAPSSVGPGSGGGLRTDGTADGPATSVDSRPIPLNSPAPRYTEEARNNKIQGTVTMRVLVGADGQVKQVRVVRGLPDGLDEQAIQVAYQLKFKPAMKDGKPVAFWIAVSAEFNLGRK